MKQQTKIFFLAFALVVAIQVAANATEAIRGVSEKPVWFMLKMNKQFVGGEVQVYSGGSALILSQKMKKRKVSIDFSQVMAGEYIVRVLKGNEQQEYHFLKK